MPIANKEIRLVDMAKVCPYAERSLERWLADYKESGMAELENKSRRPKSNPKETPIRIKMRNNEYNDLEHCGLNGLSPNEFLRLSEVQNVCG